MELHILTNQHLMKFNALNPNDNRQYSPKISTANAVTVNFPIFMSSTYFFFFNYSFNYIPAGISIGPSY
ncbi:hypothetical protein CISIN_1g048071mg [Citrus sinensis]|uniref:Uncharacterized protein n=1 Tax=Citrus sinensis TaxID=2711 RepID=A0A067F1B4_CITSI|nr:hypothetical protein CISIN_1g048071mg [Citrus sinensis]